MTSDVAIHRALKRAAWQLRVEAACQAARRTLPAAVFLASVSLLVAIVEPGIGRGSRLEFLLSGCLPFLAAIFAAARRISRRQAARACDRVFGWPDLAIASVECDGEWGERIRDDFAACASTVCFPRLWSRRSAGIFFQAVGFFVLMAAAALWLRVPSRGENSAGAPRLSEAQAAAMVERMEPVMSRPELADVMRELSAPERSRERVLLEISKAEDRLRGVSSLKLEPLADGLDGIADEAAAALRNGDLESAARALEEQAGGWLEDSPGQAARHLEHLAKMMPSQIAEALRELARAASSAEFAKAMQRLAEALRDEEKNLADFSAARLALQRLAQMREGLGQDISEPGIAEDEPEGPGGGSGAGGGKGSGPSDTFARMDPSVLMPVPGARSENGLLQGLNAGVGDPSGASGSPASFAGEGDIAEGELSRVPVVVEELPSRHRQTIRKYFELMQQP